MTSNNFFKNNLTSLKYQQEVSFYQQKLNELNTRFRKIKEDYKRNKSLFKKGVIAKVSLNDSKLNYDLALNAIYQYKKQQFSTWQNQLVNYPKPIKRVRKQ